jgi:hypothetical protein
VAYSDFTLKRVKSDFGLQVVENLSLFSSVKALEISDYLSHTKSGLEKLITISHKLANDSWLSF